METLTPRDSTLVKFPRIADGGESFDLACYLWHWAALVGSNSPEEVSVSRQTHTSFGQLYGYPECGGVCESMIAAHLADP